MENSRKKRKHSATRIRMASASAERRSHVSLQDLSKVLDLLGQDIPILHALAKKCSTRDQHRKYRVSQKSLYKNN